MNDLLKLYNQLNNHSFEMLCPKIQFVLAPGYQIIAFEGSGYVKVTENGFFEFKAIVKGDRRWIQEINPYIPHDGEDAPYFQLKMWDSEGNEWCAAEWITPILESPFYNEYVRLRGRVSSISRDIPPRRLNVENEESYTFLMHNPGRLPWTKSKVTEVFKDNKNQPESFSREPCYQEIEIEGIHFLLEKLDQHNLLRATITSKDRDLPPFIDIKLQESLIFTTAKPLNFTIQMRDGKRHKLLRITPIGNRLTSRIPSPVRSEQGEHTDKFWGILKNHLSFLIKTDGSNPLFHPISNSLIAIMEASTRSPNIYALMLGVAVEAVLEKCQKTDSKDAPDDEYTKAADRIHNLVKRWNGNQRIKNRLAGTTSKLKNWSIKDRLNLLVETKIITKTQMNAWEKLRHKAAHGAGISESSLNRELNHLVSETLSMLYAAIQFETNQDHLDKPQLKEPV